MTTALAFQEADLEANYRRLRRRFKKAFPPEAERFVGAPITHTFPAERTLGETTRDRRLVYEDVLFSDRALLSNALQEEEGRLLPDEPRPKMQQAREMGLQHFVFGYLGVHDPYYSRSTDVPIPLFGVFLSPNIEQFPQCHATRRDLASPEADKTPTRDFLYASDARDLACCEWSFLARHKGDFWHYYGAPTYWRECPLYLSKMWEWKFEFHYSDRVPLNDLKAILWPHEVRLDLRGGLVPSPMTQRASEFRRQWPGITVILYEWSQQHPASEFAEASYLVSRFFMTEGHYPETLEDARALA